jgi:hypothetical protein
VETISIPPQVSLWVKTHRLTVIGENLNEGFDHLEEGVGLELSLNAQIISIQYLPSY